MKIWAYAICWNEAKILPYYLRHYSQFCEKIIIYDNGSDDGSQEIIKSHPKAVLRHYDTSGQIKDDVYLQIKNNCWKESRGKADWVIVGDIDELVYHPNIIDFLAFNGSQHSVFKPAGVNMIADKFPTTSGQIYEEVQRGSFHPGSCKPMLFDPNRVAEINFDPGGHTANRKKITGKLWLWRNHHGDPFRSPIKVLHFKFMGLNYVTNRYRQLANRLSESNKKRGWGSHYLKGNTGVISEFKQIKQSSKQVI
jgi:glycosyltransferase involved in cell wall biosynthesis